MRIAPKFSHHIWGRQLDNPPLIHDKKAVFNRLGHLLLIVALLGATGGHWAMLQSVAWATMLADNAQTNTFEAALQKTFDGNHPCALCKQIAQGSQSEKKSELQITLKKLEFSHQSVLIVLNSPSHFWLPGESRVQAPLRVETPAVPPPRSLPA